MGIGGIHKLSRRRGVDIAVMLVPVVNRLGGFIEDVDDMSRFQDQGRQNLVQSVYESG